LLAAVSCTVNVVGLVTVTVPTVTPGIGASVVVPLTKFVFTPVTVYVPLAPCAIVAGLIEDRIGSQAGSKSL
jgi:hypothetical protein